MNFYCEECEVIYDEKDLNKRYYLNSGEKCYECPECQNMKLTAIAQNTELDVSWDEKAESITSIQYDSVSELVNDFKWEDITWNI